jgi:hypothetical protein
MTPNGKEMRLSISEPLKETLQIDAEAIPPKKTSCQGEYKGFESMSVSNAAEASVTDISSWMTYAWGFSCLFADHNFSDIHPSRSRMHLVLSLGPAPSLAV